ncbi:MAG: xanthine dehydrogenase YagR molybdenum-binding subunit, partial [Mycobacterium sp.]|nr:xanthine dehydrogenase YagR molybdenum-binding subunit [Mycobacterium sp.]
MTTVQPRAIGTAMRRIDGPAKVTGTATYAFEYVVDAPLYLHPLQATIARGRITAMNTTEAHAVDGVHAILTGFDAPTLADTDDG